MTTFATLRLSDIFIMVLILASVVTAQIVARANISHKLETNRVAAGCVFIIEFAETVKIVGELTGFKEGDYGFRINTRNNLTHGCDSTGPVYDPEFVRNRSGPNATVRPVGDLGNVTADAKGVINIDISDLNIQLSKGKTVLGRTFVIFGDPDSGGNNNSFSNGEVGPGVACGVIKQIKTNIGANEVSNRSNQLGMNQLLLAFVIVTLFHQYK